MQENRPLLWTTFLLLSQDVQTRLSWLKLLIALLSKKYKKKKNQNQPEEGQREQKPIRLLNR